MGAGEGDPSLRERLALAARAFVSSRHDLERLNDDLATLLRDESARRALDRSNGHVKG